MGASQVYAFEVDKTRFEIARENVHINKLNKVIHLFNAEVTGKSISAFINENHLWNIFLKLDCEGCEYEVISDLPEEVYRHIDDIVMEYHKNSVPITNRLKELGYNVKSNKTVNLSYDPRLKKMIRIPLGQIFASKDGK